MRIEIENIEDEMKKKKIICRSCCDGVLILYILIYCKIGVMMLFVFEKSLIRIRFEMNWTRPLNYSNVMHCVFHDFVAAKRARSETSTWARACRKTCVI
mgnify:CR=1 FL=1